MAANFNLPAAVRPTAAAAKTPAVKVVKVFQPGAARTSVPTIACPSCGNHFRPDLGLTITVGEVEHLVCASCFETNRGVDFFSPKTRCEVCGVMFPETLVTCVRGLFVACPSCGEDTNKAFSIWFGRQENLRRTVKKTSNKADKSLRDRELRNAMKGASGGGGSTSSKKSKGKGKK